MKNKKKQEITSTELRLQRLELALLDATKNMLTINDAKKRDYIVRTKYYGKIKDSNIKKDFKEEIEAKTRDTFDGVCTNILNYYFVIDTGDYTGSVLELFYKTLERYEYRQIVLDTYGK